MIVNEQRDNLQEEAFEALKQNGFNGAVILPTGSGKTKVAIKAIQYLTDIERILYTCDNKKLRDEDFPAELERWGGNYLSENITRMCYQSAYKLTDKYYDVLIMDEGDYGLTPEYIKLLENNQFKYIIFLSATLSEEKQEMIEQYVPIVYKKEVREVEDDKVINKANLYFVNFMLTRYENNRYLGYNERFKHLLNAPQVDRRRLEFLTRERKLFLSGLESARKTCQQLLSKLYPDRNRKILIFCSLSDQADKVCKYSYHTKNQKDNPYLALFDKGKLRVIAVVGKIDRGVNLEGVNCVIFESPGRSKTKSIQKSGRARRLHVDDISDFYFLIPFFKDRRGEIRPTIVQDWVLHSTKDFNQEFKIINL